MIRDSASNGVKASEDWGIYHASCIIHILHRLVGPFLVPKRKSDRRGDDADLGLDDDENDCTIDDEVDDDDVLMTMTARGATKKRWLRFN
jgi:hypothetical protein